MFRTQSASIFRSNILQTVVAATGVCYRYGVDKSRIGVIGSVCIIPGSIDVDGLAMFLGNPHPQLSKKVPINMGPKVNRFRDIGYELLHALPYVTHYS